MFKALNLNFFFPAHNTRSYQPARIQPVKKAYVWAGYALVALNAVLLFSYLVGVNTYASEGYSIKKLQGQISSLSEENKKLTIKISEQTAIGTVEAQLANSTFVPVGQPVFLQVNQYSER